MYENFVNSCSRFSFAIDSGANSVTVLTLSPKPFCFGYSVTSENARQDEIDDFKAEIDFMKTIGLHENIVTMLGCSTLYHPVCLIVEYVPHGDLLHYLRDLRKKVCKMIFMEHSIPIRTSFYSLRK